MVTLLIDADIICYKAAARNEVHTPFGKQIGKLEDCIKDAEEMITGYKKRLKAKDCVMVLSCRQSNFRESVLPTYKNNRSSDPDKRPFYLSAVKKHIQEEYDALIWYALEGDDVLGILHTHPDQPHGDTIVVSEDKDLRTVPGRLYAPHREELGIIDITPLEANQFLCWQTICGDSTDGYKGAFGVGAKSIYAEEVIAADADELWDIVLEAYASVDMTEADAIQQAQCAKILTSDNYNDSKGEVILWTPDQLMM